MMAAPSPLALLPPVGPSRPLVIGSGCPQSLASAASIAGEPAELVVLAPAAGEGDRAWREPAVRTAIERLAEDATCTRSRRDETARASLRCCTGTASPSTPVAHLPDARTSAYMVPVGGATAQ